MTKKTTKIEGVKDKKDASDSMCMDPPERMCPYNHSIGRDVP